MLWELGILTQSNYENFNEVFSLFAKTSIEYIIIKEHQTGLMKQKPFYYQFYISTTNFYIYNNWSRLDMLFYTKPKNNWPT